jgi:hypothetical protein
LPHDAADAERGVIDCAADTTPNVDSALEVTFAA